MGRVLTGSAAPEERSKGRSYNQYCGLATGLDVVGARWSLLLIRELMIGSTRFGDLQRALPGIGPNLLAERLKELMDAGVVERRLANAGGRREIYTLTDLGEALRPAVLELAKWGLKLVKRQPSPEDAVRSEWAMLAVEALTRGVSVGSDVNESYQFQIADDVFCLKVVHGRATVAVGETPESVLRVRADAQTLVQLGAGLVDPTEALNDGRLEMVGDFRVALRCCALLGITTSSAVA
jgi:DNA-binding HxlR family transcriptional regulator/putative sterol carrier protein